MELQESLILEAALPTLADTPGIWRATFLVLTAEQIRNSARRFQCAIPLVLEVADRAVALSELDRPLQSAPWNLRYLGSEYFAAAFEPMMHSTSVASVAS